MLFEILFMFAFGAVCGWIIEVVYRSINQKKLVNPGFLSGPYLPVYGFGTLILFGFSSLEINLWLRVVLFFGVTTLLELVTGLVFVYYYGIKLWDYSKKWMNFRGLVCFEFSCYWTLLALGFYFIMYPFLRSLVLFSNIIVLFFLGFFYGVLFLDFFSTLGVAQRIRSMMIQLNKDKISKLKVNYFLFRESVTLKFFRKSHKHFVKKFFLPLQNLKSRRMVEYLNNFLKKKD